MDSQKRLRISNSSVAFVLAGIVATTLHEASHFFTALLLGNDARIFPTYVATAKNTSLNHNIIVATAGPIFSLLSGLLIIRLLSNRGSGFIRLFWTWLGFLSAQIGFGYFLIAPLARSGDTGYVLLSLHTNWVIYTIVFIIGAIGTYYILPRMFSKKISPLAENRKDFFQLGMYSWLIGTGVMLVIYSVLEGRTSHTIPILFLNLAGIATVGLFTPMAYYKSKDNGFLNLKLTTPIIPIILTVLGALFLIFGLAHGIPR
jgi:hypothetical protein